jgi:hypothetical protein
MFGPGCAARRGAPPSPDGNLHRSRYDRPAPAGDLRRLELVGVREVMDTEKNTALVIIGIAMLVVAFATLVIKIIEVARSK